MSAEHPSALMRRAASRLRELAGRATPVPWRVSFIDGTEPIVDGPGPDGHMVAEMYQCGDPVHGRRPKADAELIVLLRNSVEPLAGLLEETARRADDDVMGGPVLWWHRGCAFLDSGCACWDKALATAHAILGEG